MPTDFDPYRKWLGIPPQFQPPNYYRLLGIEPFETDPDVIAHAADQRAVHLKTFATGPNSALSQQLLNEVAGARVCLLNPAEKARYDAALREEQAATVAPLAAAAAPPRRAAPAVRVAEPTLQSAPPSSNPNRTLIIAGSAAGVVLVGVVVALAVALSGNGNKDNLLANNSAAEQEEPKRPAESEPKPVTPNAEPVAEPTPKTPAPPKETPKEKPRDPVISRPPPPPGPGTMADLMNAPDEPKEPTPKEPPDPGTKKPPPKVKPPRPPKETSPGTLGDLMKGEEKPVKRTAPPDASFVETKTKQVREIYKEKFQQATTPENKRALAREIEKLASETKGDAQEQYVLLDVAAVLTAEAEAIDEALLIVNRIESLFEISGHEKKAAVIARAASLGAKLSLTGAGKLVAAAQRAAEDALLAGEVAAAISLLEAAIKVAERSKDPAAMRAVNSLKKQARELEPVKAQYELAKKAEERLAQEPENAKANAVTGAWHCFVRDDWVKGLSYLAKADEATLATLAAKDKAAPTESKQQIEVADGWWDLAKQRKGVEQHHIQCRAVHWYEKALKSASGLEKATLTKSLSEKGLWHTPYALKFNGKSTVVKIDNLRYDGTFPITLEAIVQSAGTVAERSSMYEQAIVGNLCDYKTGLGLAKYSETYTMKVIAGGIYRSYDSTGYLGRSQADTGWVHVAGIYDGQEVRTYVDGKLKGRRPVIGAHTPSPLLPFIIGAEHYQPSISTPATTLQHFFYGSIRGVRVSNIARYQKEFKAPETLIRDPASMVLYQFTEGKGAKLTDASGHKCGGTIADGEWTALEAELRRPTLGEK